MDGDNILRFPVSKTAINPRTEEMTTLAEDISELRNQTGRTAIGRSLRRLSEISVQAHDRQVEHGCKSDPGGVGQEQDRGDTVRIPLLHDEGENRCK